MSRGRASGDRRLRVEGRGTASQGPRPTNLGWTEASAGRSYKRSFPRCSDSHLIGGTPVFSRQARKKRTRARSRQRRSPQRDRGVGALMGCPVGSASTIRKTATTPSAEPSKTSANLLRNAGFPTAPTQASPAAQRSRPSTPANRPPRLERCRALAQESEALLALGLRLEKGDAL